MATLSKPFGDKYSGREALVAAVGEVELRSAIASDQGQLATAVGG